MMRGQRPQTLNIGGNNALVASMLLFSQVKREIFIDYYYEFIFN
jgi:hypothetical protein